MIKEYDLRSRGFSTEFSYNDRKAAYRGAQKLALRNDSKASKIIESEERKKSGASNKVPAAADLDSAQDLESKKLSEKRQPRKNGGGSGKYRSAIRGGVLGLGVGFVSSAVFGSETPLEDSFESLDIFSPSSMGNSEIDPDLWAYDAWGRYQRDLDRRWIDSADERVQARYTIK